MTTEEWRAVVGFPDYEVSDQGRVRRATPYVSTRVGKILKLRRHRGGYLCVNLSSGGKVFARYVHRLVAEAFHGPSPSSDHQAAHLNGDRSDNKAMNLEWSTRAENEAHKIIHGTKLVGAACHMAKFTEDQIRDIRAIFAAGGITQTELAKRYGTRQSQIFKIVSRETWKHVA